jgi:hypothetical protein
MKTRNGFVSNSSSASFVLSKRLLSEVQLVALRNHIEVGQWLGIEYALPRDAWRMHESKSKIEFGTIIDNFDLGELIDKIGARGAVTDEGDSYGWWDEDEERIK